VRAWDAQSAIYDELRALSWRRYVAAQWILGTELANLYADQFSELESSLAESTLSIVRDVGTSGASAQHVGEAAELAHRWGRVIAAGEHCASRSLLNAWMTFEGAVVETRVCPRAITLPTGWVAAVRRWRDQDRRGRRRVDHDEEVADDTPMARTLAKFKQVVRGVAHAPDRMADPVVLRTQILGP
jgi:hypothetical protein